MKKQYYLCKTFKQKTMFGHKQLREDIDELMLMQSLMMSRIDQLKEEVKKLGGFKKCCKNSKKVKK